MGRRWLTWIAVGLSTLAAIDASGQVTSLGLTNSGTAKSGALSAVAYSDKADVFLHVWESSDFVRGRVIGFDGSPRTAEFVLAPSGATSSSGASVAYSRGAVDDVFVVMYAVGSTMYLQSVAFTGAASVGMPIAMNTAGNAAVPRQVIFNPRTRMFVATWVAMNASTNLVALYLQSMSVAGTTVGSPILLRDIGFQPVFARGIALDWQANRYVAGYDSSLPGSCGAYGVSGVSVDSATNTPGPFIGFGGGTGAAAVRDLAIGFLPEAPDVLGAWTLQDGTPCPASSPTHRRVVGRVAQNGTVTTFLDTAGNDWAPSLDYDAACRCVLVVAEASALRSSFTAEFLDAVMLDGTGQPTSSPFRLSTSTTTTGSFKPQVLAARNGVFVVVYATDHGALLERFSAPLAAAAGPKFSNVVGYLDEPAASSTLDTVFAVRGWAADFADSSTTGIEIVHVWAFPTDGRPPIFLNKVHPVEYYVRTDVAAAYGSRFLRSGFEFNTGPTLLTEGTYKIVAYPQSRVTGAFTRLGESEITVRSRPAMAIDAPTTVSQLNAEFVIEGWAVDLARAWAGPGVDAIHAWAFPVGGGTPVFIGTGLTVQRSDVKAAFGDSYFSAGFRIFVSGLPAGDYDIGVYAHSAVSGTFNNSRVFRVRVPAAQARVEMSIDQPAPNQQIGTTFSLGGWAIDGRFPTGAGVDVVHVYAFPVGGGAPIFVAALANNVPRSDVAALYGSRFLRSGYTSFNVTFPGPPGSYDLAVYAHSSFSGAFDQVRMVRITR